MLRTHVRRFALISLLATTACTQPAARIELRGQNHYGNSSVANNSYTGPISKTAPSSYTTNAAPVHSYNPSTNTVPNASVGSITSSDLAPPTAVSATPAARSIATTTSTATYSAPANSPFKPASLAPSAGTPTRPVPAAAINPWTNKPREVEKATDEQSFKLRPQASNIAPKQQLVSEVKKPGTEKAVSKLDSIIGNEGSEVPLTKPIVKAEGGSFMWPVNSKKVISSYGPKGKGQTNDGINIASADGEPVWAAADGEVVYVGNELQGYGNMVLIKHAGEKSTSYSHMSRATVDKYDRVKQGDIIGYVGNTGGVKESQLHFAVREGKEPVDPVKFLKRNVASLK